MVSGPFIAGGSQKSRTGFESSIEGQDHAALASDHRLATSTQESALPVPIFVPTRAPGGWTETFQEYMGPNQSRWLIKSIPLGLDWTATVANREEVQDQETGQEYEGDLGPYADDYYLTSPADPFIRSSSEIWNMEDPFGVSTARKEEPESIW